MPGDRIYLAHNRLLTWKAKNATVKWKVSNLPILVDCSSSKHIETFVFWKGIFTPFSLTTFQAALWNLLLPAWIISLQSQNCAGYFRHFQQVPMTSTPKNLCTSPYFGSQLEAKRPRLCNKNMPGLCSLHVAITVSLGIFKLPWLTIFVHLYIVGLKPNQTFGHCVSTLDCSGQAKQTVSPL